MNYLKKASRLIHENRKYILFGTALMLLGALAGYLNADSLKDIAQGLLKELERIAKRIHDHDSLFYTFWLIFENNVLASLSMLGLGVFFGVFPAVGLFSNGILLGFLLKTYAVNGVSPLSVFVFGILPHGIFELTAVIIASSLGIRYGLTVFSLLKNMAQPHRRASILQDFGASLKDLPYMVGLIIFLLLVAAVVESSVTPALIHAFLGDQMLG